MIKLALFGCGKWANNYIKNINILGNYAEIVYLHSRSVSSYLNLKEKPNNHHCWVWDVDRILKNPEIKGVIIATPPETHYKLVLACLQAGKHVLCEKPFVFKEEEAKELFDLAEEKKLSLIVNYIHLWNKFYQNIYNDKNIDLLNIGEIIFEVGAPNQNREHHSVLYDWASHDLAMLIHLYKGFFPTDVKSDFDPQNPKNRKLKIEGNILDSKFSIIIDADSYKSSRRITIHGKDGLFKQTRDTFEYNALREVIVDFLNATGHNIAVNNKQVTINVTRLLNIISENTRINPEGKSISRI